MSLRRIQMIASSSSPSMVVVLFLDLHFFAQILLLLLFLLFFQRKEQKRLFLSLALVLNKDRWCFLLSRELRFRPDSIWPVYCVIHVRWWVDLQLLIERQPHQQYQLIFRKRHARAKEPARSLDNDYHRPMRSNHDLPERHLSCKRNTCAARFIARFISLVRWSANRWRHSVASGSDLFLPLARILFIWITSPILSSTRVWKWAVKRPNEIHASTSKSWTPIR